MFTPAKALRIDENQWKCLKHLARSGKTPQKIALRARIVLLAGEGVPNNAIASRLGISRPTVLLWRGRFAAGGDGGPPKVTHTRWRAGVLAGRERVHAHRWDEDGSAPRRPPGTAALQT